MVNERNVGNTWVEMRHSLLPVIRSVKGTWYRLCVYNCQNRLAHRHLLLKDIYPRWISRGLNPGVLAHLLTFQSPTLHDSYMEIKANLHVWDFQ